MMNTEKVTSKVCTKCGEEKVLEEFHRKKTGKYGRQPKCKACRKAEEKQYQAANAEKIAARMKAYYKANKEAIAEYQKAWRENNKENIAAKAKAYREANKEARAARNRAWREANPNYIKNRYTSNPKFRAMCLLRTQIRRLGDYKSETTIEIVGISGEEFWKRNGSPSVEQMEDLHIDHIVPLSWFDLSNEDHVAVSSHHSNLQYLSEEDNRAKGNRYAGNPDNIIAYKDNFDIEAYVTDMLPLINIL